VSPQFVGSIGYGVDRPPEVIDPESKFVTTKVISHIEILKCAKSTNLHLGRLDAAVQHFQDAMADMGLHGAKNGVLVFLQSLGLSYHGLKAAVRGPKVPAAEAGMGTREIVLTEDAPNSMSAAAATSIIRIKATANDVKSRANPFPRGTQWKITSHPEPVDRTRS